jgi:hypothetical protein
VLQLAARAVAAGAQALNVNPSPKPNRDRISDLELNTQCSALNRLGEALAKRKLQLLVHHHDAELIENAREWQHQLQNTDPALRCKLGALRRPGSGEAARRCRNTSEEPPPAQFA